MTETILHVGTAACFAGCGALALAAQWCGRRAAELQAAEPAHVRVSDVEAAPFPADAGQLEVLGTYPVYEPDLFGTGPFQYCPEDFRVTKHTVQDDSALRCADCGSTQGDS